MNYKETLAALMPIMFDIRLVIKQKMFIKVSGAFDGYWLAGYVKVPYTLWPTAYTILNLR